MPVQEDNETYSVIYAALKHPARRRILRMLNEKEYTYTEILNTLGLDTGHLNFYLEGLGELVTKTGEGKYRLSEFGKAAVALMAGVEETENSRPLRGKVWRSKRRVMVAVEVLAIVALVAAALVFLNVHDTSEYYYGATSKQAVLEPNGTLAVNDFVSAKEFPTNTSTQNYRVLYRISVTTNASLRIQLIGGATDSTPQPSLETLPNGAYVLYDQKHVEPIPSDGTTIGYNVDAHISTDIAGNGIDGLPYEVRIENLGKATTMGETQPNHSARVDVVTQYPLIQETDTPYYYVGIAFFVMALIVALLPVLPVLMDKLRRN